MSTVLDAARRLAEVGLAEQWEPDTDYVGCPWCYATIGAASYSRYQVEAHAEDCPWLCLPAIVRALEAAERLTRFPPAYGNCTDAGETAGTEYCHYCDVPVHDGARVPSGVWHRTWCDWRTLVDALSGAAGGGPDDQTAG